jgi:histidyl-tRNA synthetase
MSKNNISIPKGTRDFSPAVMAKRNYLFGILRNAFERFGFLPIETPAMEQLSTLTGKYGEEGDQLLFKILNSGDFWSKVNTETVGNDSKKLSFQISEKALRYDLTVPFARFVVMNRNEITFPFRRFQMQPVWRADRPQKGRYREFFQCDADIIGSDSLLSEVDLVHLLDDVFSKLGLRVLIKINNRKVLMGLAEVAGITERFVEWCTALDKLDKIGFEGVAKEMRERNLGESAIEMVALVLELNGLNGMDDEIITNIKSKVQFNENLDKGFEELSTIFKALSAFHLNLSKIEIDLTLARGLNYYTGCILEVKVNEPDYSFPGSISGGGRYDDLTGIFGWKGLSGVGISFGADRIYDVMEEMKLFPEGLDHAAKIMIVNFNQEMIPTALRLLHSFRSIGVSTLLYPDAVKLQKQLTYANANNINYVLLLGEEEIQQGKLTLKDMRSGEQNLYTAEQLINFFTKH